MPGEENTSSHRPIQCIFGSAFTLVGKAVSGLLSLCARGLAHTEEPTPYSLPGAAVARRPPTDGEPEFLFDGLRHLGGRSEAARGVEALHWVFASSEESVGEFWLWKPAEDVIQRELSDPERSVAVRFSQS